MNPAIYAALPASACTLGTAGSFGPDRIARTVYDAAGQVTQQQVAVGTADAATEQTLTYTGNGKLQTLKDAENNLTTYEYDGFDRLFKTRLPLPAKGASASSTTDYEQLGYDAASNVTSRRLRDAQSIAFTFDNLNRATLKNLPGAEPDVTYAYDNLNRLTGASQTGNALSFTYDALSRNLTQVGPQGTVASQWNLAGRRTKLTYPGAGLFVDTDYLVTGETTKLRENGAVSGVGVLATFAYDDLGRRISLTRGNATVTTYGFDPVSRLATLAENLTGTTSDQSVTFAYNPASQIASLTKSNDLYAWTGTGSGSTASVANGLNQLTSIGGAATVHDSKGNLTTDPTSGKSYTYSSENLLKTATGGVTLSYDPMLRLYDVTGAATTRFAYDGLNLIAEYDGASALQRRYVHGPGTDEPLVQYEGSGTTDRRWFHSDERGSVVAISDAAGNALAINRYDEYGKPQITNTGRFQYTGQTWLPELGVYYYKARMYAPHLGRFLQTDRIGYGDGMNLYAYVRNNPVNATDPLGFGTSINVVMSACGPGDGTCPEDLADGEDVGELIIVTGTSPIVVGIEAPPIQFAPIIDPGLLGPVLGAVYQASASSKSAPKQCPAPTNVNISGTLSVYGGSAAFGTFSGTLSDPNSGRSYSFSTQIGVGGGFGIGSFDVSGTVPAFDSLDAGFGIAFGTAGYKGLGISVAGLHSLGQSPSFEIGKIEITPFILSPPLGAADIGFKNGVTRVLKKAGTGC